MAYASNSIRVVGSGSVYPFFSLIAENFSIKYNHFSSPIVEANGTGNGFKLFCAPISQSSPSVSTASRKIKTSEKNTCNNNNLNVVEINLGLDGIVLVYNKELGSLQLSKEELFLAFAEYVPDSKGKLIKNPYVTWQDVNFKLPNIAIKILGPSSGSGTRDAFFELIFHKACNSLYQSNSINDNSLDKKLVCNTIRADGAWIDGGETYALSVKKVIDNKQIFAIVGFNFYEANKEMVSALAIDNIYLNSQSLNNKTYPLLRNLYFYVKLEDIKYVVGLKELILNAISEEAIGNNGYLKSLGLISLSKQEILQQQQNINAIFK